MPKLVFSHYLPVFVPRYVLYVVQPAPEPLVVLEPGLEEVDEVLLRLLVASLEHHEGSGQVTILLVWHRNHSSVSNAKVHFKFTRKICPAMQKIVIGYDSGNVTMSNEQFTL